jgi:hypothetical protein
MVAMLLQARSNLKLVGKELLAEPMRVATAGVLLRRRMWQILRPGWHSSDHHKDDQVGFTKHVVPHKFSSVAARLRKAEAASDAG